MTDNSTYTAFVGETLVAAGSLEVLLPAAKGQFEKDAGAALFIFEDQTGRQVDFDLRGSLEEVMVRALPATPHAGPGRPKLGVVSREISLLPRHWSWLEQQPNGASAAIRRLIDEARKKDPAKERRRLATEAAGRFMLAMAGNFPGYEEATRALYADNRDGLEELIRDWPQDIRAHVVRLLDAVMTPGPNSTGGSSCGAVSTE
jgi:hypothetical protein